MQIEVSHQIDPCIDYSAKKYELSFKPKQEFWLENSDFFGIHKELYCLLLLIWKIEEHQEKVLFAQSIQWPFFKSQLF